MGLTFSFRRLVFIVVDARWWVGQHVLSAQLFAFSDGRIGVGDICFHFVRFAHHEFSVRDFEVGLVLLTVDGRGADSAILLSVPFLSL